MSLTTSTIVKLPIAPVCLNRSQSLLLRKSNSHSQAGWTSSACIRTSDRQRLGLTHLVDRSTHLVRRPHLLPLTRPHFWIVATDRPRLNEPGRPLTSRTSTFRRPSLSPRFSGCAKKEKNKKAGRRSLSPPSPSPSCSRTLTSAYRHLQSSDEPRWKIRRCEKWKIWRCEK